jgi:phage N-6-adenine-methyltransferase
MDEENNEFATPGKIWRPLARAVDGFDLDPASGAESVPIADEQFTKEDNGLSKPWFGDVFLNPPWASNGDAAAKETWLQKVRNECQRPEVRRIVVLLPVDTSTHWFHDYIVDADALCFVGPGRISFEGGDRNPSFGLLIAVFGPVDGELADVLDSFGAVFRGRSIYQQTRQQRLIPVADGGNNRSVDTESEQAGGNDGD